MLDEIRNVIGDVLHDLAVGFWISLQWLVTPRGLALTLAVLIPCALVAWFGPRLVSRIIGRPNTRTDSTS